MHEDHRLLHRDVKPGNVMLDANRRRGFLGDLGSAAELTDAGTTPAAGCTLAYRPPEYSGGTMTVQGDIYGVGLLLLEMLNGPVAWDEQDGDAMEARLDAGRRALPNRHYDPAPWVPPKVARVARRLTSPDPANRPASAAAALRDLGNASCVDWRRNEGVGLIGTWEATYPPGMPARRARVFRVTAEPVTTARHKGKVTISAVWRHGDAADWRRYATLTRRVPAGDASALGRFFREVERNAQATPTR